MAPVQLVKRDVVRLSVYLDHDVAVLKSVEHPAVAAPVQSRNEPNLCPKASVSIEIFGGLHRAIDARA